MFTRSASSSMLILRSCLISSLTCAVVLGVIARWLWPGLGSSLQLSRLSLNRLLQRFTVANAMQCSPYVPRMNGEGDGRSCNELPPTQGNSPNFCDNNVIIDHDMCEIRDQAPSVQSASPDDERMDLVIKFYDLKQQFEAIQRQKNFMKRTPSPLDRNGYDQLDQAGCIGCVWFVFWVFLVYNTPAEHPRISKRELMYIQQNLPQVSAERNNRPIPWGQIVRSKAVWAVTVAKFAGTWGFTCLLTKLPAYLADVLHFPIQKNGMINALVYTAEIAAMFLSGCSSDYIRKKNWLSNTNIRKLFETLALVGPTICLVLIPAMGCNQWPVVALIIMSMGFYGMVGGGDIPAFVDIAPELAGTIFGLANGIAGTTGFLSPLVAGIFLDKDHGGMFQWSKVFYTSCGIYAGGALVFLIFGSAEPEPWAVSQEEPTSSGEYSRKASVRSDIEISLSIHASCPR